MEQDKEPQREDMHGIFLPGIIVCFLTCVGLIIGIIVGVIVALQLTAVGQHTPENPIIITRDGGGSISEYRAKIAAAEQAGVEVRIEGPCYSACTMWLKLETACVTRDQPLGFKGPSSNRYGIGLDPFSFDYWSRVMAEHYPEVLRPWFMGVARHETMSVLRVRGGELVDNFGVKECKT